MVENALRLPTHGAITEYWLGLLGESPDALDFMTKFTSKAPEKAKPKPQAMLATVWNQKSVPKPVIKTHPRLVKKVNTTTSHLLDKSAPKLSKQCAKREKQKKIDNLKDLDIILSQLESQSTDTATHCNCMATRHPLFEAAPNCLNCGKIICVKEGLKPCGFCGKELISPEEKANIIGYLESEKEQLEYTAERKPLVDQKKKRTKVTIASGAGVNLWKQQEAMFKRIEAEKSQKAQQEKKQIEEAKKVKEQSQELQFYANQKSLDPDLLKAKANLENLMNFQANSAERTKIIDQASDFELPTGSNLNIWSNGVEKALQLKKQQRQFRKQEKRENELKGRGKRVLDITIGKDGKAVMRELKSTELEDSEDDDDEIEQLEKEISDTKAKKAEQDFKTVWDYEKEQKKWEKPTYVGSAKEEDGMDVPEFNWGRVQQLQNTEGELEELVAAL
jgi:hypothetical protein